MTDLSKLILNNYLIRKTTKQKTDFINLMKKNFNCSIQSSRLNRNIIIGNVKTAKTVYTAHYDTPATLPFPNLLTPTSLFKHLLYQLFIACIMLIPILLISYSCGYIFDFFYYESMSDMSILILYYTLSLFPFFILLVILYLMLCGPANKSNTNDNTSGIITLIELYNTMSKETKQECAFVFFDNEEKGLLGSRLFKKIYKKEMKKFILVNFDCVGDGDNILLVHNKKAKIHYKEDIKNFFNNHSTKKLLDDKGFCIFPSDNVGFTNNIGICALKHNKILGYYCDKIHTKKDVEFDEENIKYLVETFNNYQYSLLSK